MIPQAIAPKPTNRYSDDEIRLQALSLAASTPFFFNRLLAHSTSPRET